MRHFGLIISHTSDMDMCNIMSYLYIDIDIPLENCVVFELLRY